MKNDLTRKQEMVLRHIFESTMRDGYQPSFMEVCTHFGWSNRNATQCFVVALRRKGYIGPGTNESRALRLLRCPDGSKFCGFVCKGGDNGSGE